MIYIACLLACILWTVVVALASAAHDAERIALNEPIRHGRSWVIRALLVFAVCFAAGLPWLVIGMGALFSMVFRFALNDVRDLDWRYVSPSSWYDWQFIRIAQPIVLGTRDEAIKRHGWRYSTFDIYPDDIHRAGLLAYIVEFVVLVVTLFLV